MDYLWAAGIGLDALGLALNLAAILPPGPWTPAVAIASGFVGGLITATQLGQTTGMGPFATAVGVGGAVAAGNGFFSGVGTPTGIMGLGTSSGWGSVGRGIAGIGVVVSVANIFEKFREALEHCKKTHCESAN